MRFAARQLAFLRFATAGAALLGFVFALILAASPQLHELAHHPSDEPGHHECLAMMLHDGTCEHTAAPPTLATFVATLFEVTLPDRSRPFESLFLSCRILEHAPPGLI
jgi:hypothetical protein